jgi:hypothetical protein
MALELWILLVIALAGLAVCIGLRLRNSRRRATGEAKNFYPLW